MACKSEVESSLLPAEVKDAGPAWTSVLRRNQSAITSACSRILTREILGSGPSLLTRSLAHLCLPGGPAQCRTLTSENQEFCLQQIWCVRSAQLSVDT